MKRAILTCMHSYQPFGQEFYTPILDFFLSTMRKYKDEFDTLYLIEDDNWELPKQEEDWIKIVKVPPSLRYYDAFKEVLPSVKEELILLIDSDMVVYKPDRIGNVFTLLQPYPLLSEKGKTLEHEFDVVSITDTIGTMKVPLKTGNKLCPYWFGTRKELLLKYLDVDWSPDAMPYTETFGLLTEAMLKDGAKVYEMEDDKSGIHFDGSKTDEKGKDLGYYHVRSGSTPAYLLATKKYGDRKTYDDYLKNQPKNEYLRQLAWYMWMCNETQPHDNLLDPLAELIFDSNTKSDDLKVYYQKFVEFHGL